MRIAIVGTGKWALHGIAQCLQQAGGDTVQVQLLQAHNLLVPDARERADVVIAVQADAKLAEQLETGVPAGVAILWLGGTGPPSSGARATGHLAAEADDARLLAAVRALAAGLHVRDDAHAFAPASASARESVLSEPLTPRELEVLELMAKGLGNRDIAQALGISSHTAKFHVAQILEKAGAATRTEAVRQALRLGLIGL